MLLYDFLTKNHQYIYIFLQNKKKTIKKVQSNLVEND
jgi:hypothetical protein